MQRLERERGAALIMLIGITAVLAILAATMVMALGNQQAATTAEASHKSSVYDTEGLLDSAVQFVKSQPMPTAPGDPEWLTYADFLQLLNDEDILAPGAQLTGFLAYDNCTPLNRNTAPRYDANGDGMMWLEVTLVYQGKTTRMRCLVSQFTQNVIKSFPKAVVYSDTGIKLDSTSDVYAVEPDGTTPYNPAQHGGTYSTTVMAGGGKYSASDGAQDFWANTTANLAAFNSSAQSVNVNVNGHVKINGVTNDTKFGGTVIGGVGLLSDYFDQAAQADLGDEAQAGASHVGQPGTPAVLPTPSAPTPTPTATPSTTVLNDWKSTTNTNAIDVSTTDYKVSGNLTLSRGTSTTMRTFKFRKLYVTGNLTLTGAVQVTCTDFLRVDGTITIGNTTTTAVTDTFSGGVWAGSTSASAASGNVTITTGTSPPGTFYTGGNMAFSNTSTTTGALYVKGTLGLTGNSPLTASSVYSGGALTISGATSPITDQVNGTLWAASTSANAVSGTVTLNATTCIYSAGPLAFSNTAVTTPNLFVASTSQGNNSTSTADALSIAAGTTVNVPTALYSAGTIMIKGPTTTGLLYAGAAYASSVDPNLATPKGNMPALCIFGNTTVKSTSLVVLNGDFRITGATSAVTDELGPIWVGGTSSQSIWSGTASVKTTYYNNPTAAAGPMWLTILDRSGQFNDVYGDTWLTGNAGTSHVAWKVTGPTSGTACTVMCPLLATTEKTEIRGKVNFGSMTHPMVYYMMCDNDSLYSNTFLLGDVDNSQPFQGTFYGLMVIMEACAKFYSTDATTPVVVGAVFNGTPYISTTSESAYDITLSGSAAIAYDQAILDAVTNDAITTVTQTTQIVQGSWQQIPVTE